MFLCGIGMGFGIAWATATWVATPADISMEKCAKCCQAAKLCGDFVTEMVVKIQQQNDTK